MQVVVIEAEKFEELLRETRAQRTEFDELKKHVLPSQFWFSREECARLRSRPKSYFKYFESKDGGGYFLFDSEDYTGSYFLAELTVSLDTGESDTPTYAELDQLVADLPSDNEHRTRLENIKRQAQRYRNGRRLGRVLEYLDKKLQLSDQIVG